MRLFISALLIILAVGCASIGIRDSSLQLQISPLPVLRGQPALAQVNAPLDAEKVIGTVMTMGSPRLIFREDKDKGIWFFYGTIPFSPWVQPGSYTVRVTVYSAHEKPHFTEMKLDLK